MKSNTPIGLQVMSERRYSRYSRVQLPTVRPLFGKGAYASLGCVDKSTPVPDYGYRNPKNAINDISHGSTNTPTPGADAPVPIDEVRDETARSCQRQNH